MALPTSVAYGASDAGSVSSTPSSAGTWSKAEAACAVDTQVRFAGSKPKTATAPLASEMPKFEIPRFDLPKFEVPKMEVPAAFREFAEKSVTQAKDNWEKMKAASEEASDLIEDSYATASKGASDYGLKVIEVSRGSNASTWLSGNFDR